MTTAPPNTHSWPEANKRYLMASVALVRSALERHVLRARGKKNVPGSDAIAEQALADAKAAMPAPSALDSLCAAFGLSPFDRDVLLLCAGMELDAAFAAQCAAAQGFGKRSWFARLFRKHVSTDSEKVYPTFSLAFAALPNAHWDALSSTAPLRYWRLIEVTTNPSLVSAPLRIDERVLHYLTGVHAVDDRLRGLIEPVRNGQVLVSSQEDMADTIAGVWRNAKPASLPVVQLCGSDEVAVRGVAAKACHEIGMHTYVLRQADIPSIAAEREPLARTWEREALLSRSALVIEAEESDNTESFRTLSAFLESLRGVVLVARREPLRLRNRPVVRFDVPQPSAIEQKKLWEKALGEDVAAELNGNVEKVVTQFNLGARGIEAATVQFKLHAQETTPLGEQLWDACRAQARSRLDDLAQRITPFATWDDLILPENPQRQTLRELVLRVRQRAKVYDNWGFATKGARGLGITAAFVGGSGVGKTTAAEALARELRLDLYRIDLSSVVSKYIGETEKNLRRIFDSAEEGGAILLFDEADALFGKRSEVKDSHDRYANIEVSYLLQRMESYRGLAILTTNMKEALDTAFLRRIQFFVHFPFPDAEQRAQIWQRIFPESTPRSGDLDLKKLSRLNVAGGTIRNIAMNAAFLASDPKLEINSLVHPRHVQNAQSLTRKLLCGSDEVSRLVWSKFSDSAKKAISDQTPCEPKQREKRQKALLAEQLNLIIRSGAIHDEEAFAAINLSEETRAFLMKPPGALDLHRLNRWLLSDAFPEELSPPKGVGMEHIKEAARSEYAKLERPLTDAEVGDWLT